MKIVYFNTPIYDYMTGTLVEGLNELGHDVTCSEASNYGGAAPEAELPQRAEQADLIVVGSNVGVRHHLLQGVSNPRKVFVDGSDGPVVEAPSAIRFKAVFKRELCREDRDARADGVYPLTFAAERRYFTPSQPKDILVSFVASMNTNPMRNSVHVRLRNRQNPRVISGTTNERSYTPGRPRPLPVETPGYRNLLARSLISVNVPGWGYDCARYWEIPAAGAMLLTYLPDITIPNGFQDGVDCATFASLEEFDSKLDFYIGHPDIAAQIAERGRQRLLQHHTTARRAAYFLENAMEAALGPGYCARFLCPEIRALENVCVGRGVDVGCCAAKTTPSCIGVGPIAKGEICPSGSEAGKVSVADICSSGDNLNDFTEGSLDFVVSRHDLERRRDPAGTLAEWKRVVRTGGRIGVVVSNQAANCASAQDPASCSRFTMDAFRAMVDALGGLTVNDIGLCPPNQSFFAVLTRTG